jgi:hypothetical protein
MVYANIKIVGSMTALQFPPWSSQPSLALGPAKTSVQIMSTSRDNKMSGM